MTLKHLEIRADRLQVSIRDTHPPLSEQSKSWLLTLARIKFQIEQSAYRLSDEAAKIQWKPNSKLPDSVQWFQEDEYRIWSQNIRERASRIRPVTEDEAWSFMIDTRGLWIWQLVSEFCANWPDNTSEFPAAQLIAIQRNKISPLVYFSQQLINTASAVKINDLSTLSEIIDAVELQLSVLGSFGDIYYRKLTDHDRIEHVNFDWHHVLRSRIDDVVKQANAQRAAAQPTAIRSHLQHHQDNLLLQAIVCIALLACIYPLYRALNASSSAPGSTSEADFFLQIINSTVQLTSFLTLLLPIYRETAAKEWIGTWILTILGSVSAIIAVPLYLFVPMLWSAFFSWLATSAQLLVVLQLAMVAAFRDQQHAKQD